MVLKNMCRFYLGGILFDSAMLYMCSLAEKWAWLLNMSDWEKEQLHTVQ